MRGNIAMSDETIEFDSKKLDAFIKALKGDLPIARIGILGDKSQRTGKTLATITNAQIGRKHEFGEDGMPVRSFLRVPLIDHMQEYLEKSGAFTPDVLLKVINEKSVFQWVAKIGIVGESIVADGFDSGGFGKWQPSNMKFKKNHQTLVETQQLRNSITSSVK